MIQAERERAYLVRQSIESRPGQREAAARLGLGVRQFKRLVRKARIEGDAGLVSRQNGWPSNNQMSAELRTRITTVLTAKYPDFGATLAAEKLL